MADLQTNANDNSLTDSINEDGVNPDGSWSIATLRAKASAIFASNLSLKLVNAPPDGECLIHSLTRSLGLMPLKQWSGTLLLDWAHLFRLHLARHISGEDQQAFLYSHNYLEDRYAILFARLWRLRITIHPYQESPRRNLQFIPVQYFPVQVDDDLLDIRLALQANKTHYDYLFPRQSNFYRHTCTVTAADLRDYFSGSDGEVRFDRFIFKWLDVLRSPNNASRSSVYKFSSVAEFISTFNESDWPMPEYHLGLLTPDSALFAHNELVISDTLQSEEEGSDDGVSSSSIANPTNVAAPPSDVESNNR
jgi:hypothetical protein